MKQQPLRAGALIRIYREDKCFGPGVAELLERVEAVHSLRRAAMDMEMSYSKAWSILKNAERGLGIKLLDSTAGGAGGGGASLTPEAVRLLADYRAFETEAKEAIAAAFARHFAGYR